MKYTAIVLAAAASVVATHPPVPDFCEVVTKTVTVPIAEPTGAPKFDCEFAVHATPDQVVNAAGTAPAPGEPGASGLYKYGIVVSSNTIFYDITLNGVTGEYQSPARTATHIHQGARGAAGPPRIALPNPQPADYGLPGQRFSKGSLTGPFKTGILVMNQTGTDTGDGFNVKSLCDNPVGFFTDSHTRQFVAGAVRGQLA